MFIALVIVIAGLYTAGLYLVLARSVVRLIFGLVLLGNAANLLIFAAGGLARGLPAIVAPGANPPVPPSGHADPVPQALVLTAIVISFALLSFAAVMVSRVCAVTGTDDGDRMMSTEGQ